MYIDRVEEVKLLKDVPGANAGDVCKLFDTSVLSGEGKKLRGVNIGKKFYWNSELLDYPNFFELR